MQQINRLPQRVLIILLTASHESQLRGLLVLFDMKQMISCRSEAQHCPRGVVRRSLTKSSDCMNIKQPFQGPESNYLRLPRMSSGLALVRAAVGLRGELVLYR